MSLEEENSQKFGKNQNENQVFNSLFQKLSDLESFIQQEECKVDEAEFEIIFEQNL